MNVNQFAVAENETALPQGSAVRENGEKDAEAQKFQRMAVVYSHPL